MALSKKFQGYQSETTLFLADLKKQKPDLEAQQRAGRARLWDKAPLDLDAMRRDKESRLRQHPYVYQAYVYQAKA
ncbi:MAG: DUF3460 family protein [Noviherbaspirillum sp.]